MRMKPVCFQDTLSCQALTVILDQFLITVVHFSLCFPSGFEFVNAQVCFDLLVLCCIQFQADQYCK